MKENIKYTLIIPYFNSEDSINKLISSVPNRDDIEIILINDNCPTFDSLRERLDNRVLYFYNDSGNKGAGACRNIGINKSNGEYIVFADSDDYFIDNAFTHFDKYSNSGFDIVYFSPISSYADGSSGSKRHVPYSDLVNKYIKENDNSIRYKFYVPWSKLIKRDLVLKNNIYFDEVLASNDINFSLKVGYFAKNIYASNENVYCVIDSKDSLTKIYTKEIVFSRFKAICDYNNFIIVNGIPTDLIRMIYFLKLIAKVDPFNFFVALIFVIRNRYPII
ncbi:glycosyltransferase family 2 protein [Grimontia hollisae]|uniref:glycosyltransferase family 2 protein n=1 Tax=Grimontia hollisae TaxID=673 RepID=UPI00130320EC|nr:glycosyltransferase [Grimontia hollisae]